MIIKVLEPAVSANQTLPTKQFDDTTIKPNKKGKCSCQKSTCSIRKLDSAAKLKHGSIISFGCLKFSISIFKCHPEDQLEEDFRMCLRTTQPPCAQTSPPNSPIPLDPSQVMYRLLAGAWVSNSGPLCSQSKTLSTRPPCWQLYIHVHIACLYSGVETGYITKQDNPATYPVHISVHCRRSTLIKMNVWADENGIQYMTLTNERKEEALQILHTEFFEDEAFCIGVGIDKSREGQKELEELAGECVKDGVSIVGIDKRTNKVAGVSFNKIQVVPPPGKKGFFEEFRDDHCITKTATSLINEMIEIDNMVDVYGKYKADSSLEIMFLGVHRDFRKRGIAKNIVSCSLEAGRQLPPTCPKRPPIATAIFTSPYSIAVGRSFKFDELLHIPIETRIYEGNSFSENPKIGTNHPGAILMVKRL